MSFVLFKRKGFKIAWSSDWASINPWSHGGRSLPFFGSHVVTDKTIAAGCHTILLGPIAIMMGFDARYMRKYIIHMARANDGGIAEKMAALASVLADLERK